MNFLHLFTILKSESEIANLETKEPVAIKENKKHKKSVITSTINDTIEVLENNEYDARNLSSLPETFMQNDDDDNLPMDTVIPNNSVDTPITLDNTVIDAEIDYKIRLSEYYTTRDKPKAKNKYKKHRK